MPGFKVDLGEGSTPGMSGAAAELFGIKPEAKAKAVKSEETKEVETMEKPSVTVSSPKELWNVLGCVTISFYNSASQDAIVESVNEAYQVWDKLRSLYADELAAESAVSGPQIALLEQLASETGTELPEDYTTMDKAAASTLISTLMKQRDAKPAPARTFGARSAAPAAKTSWSPRAGGGGSTDSGASDAQINFINRLCKQKRVDPPDFTGMSKSEASDIIKQLQAM